MPHKEFKAFSLGAVLLLVFLAGLSLFIMWGIYKAAFPPKPPFQGQMEARTVSIASRAGGRIGRILVKEGDMVAKGQLIAELALPELEARLSQAQARERASKEAQSLAEWERARARQRSRKKPTAAWRASTRMAWFPPSATTRPWQPCSPRGRPRQSRATNMISP